MRRHYSKSASGFSLIELVIVVVIIGIIGAIAIPRMSRGSAGAADSALVGNLSVLRNAVELYTIEHGGTPPDAANIANQLTSRTNAAGAVGTDPTEHIFGPYLRQIPPMPVGSMQGENSIGDGETDAWAYDPADERIVWANYDNDETDVEGTPYNQY